MEEPLTVAESVETTAIWYVIDENLDVVIDHVQTTSAHFAAKYLAAVHGEGYHLDRRPPLRLLECYPFWVGMQ